jgi:hypothetical protein
MAVSLGFNGTGNKNQGFSGGTGGGAIQPKLQLNGQGQLVTDGSGGALNYLQGLIKQSPATQAAGGQTGFGNEGQSVWGTPEQNAATARAATTAPQQQQQQGGQSAAGSAMTGAALAGGL